MQIGAMNHPARDPVAEIDWIGQYGFDFVDFTLEPPAADPDQIDVDAIRAVLDRHNLGVVAHTAYYLPNVDDVSTSGPTCTDAAAGIAEPGLYQSRKAFPITTAVG